jgi:hypothetical protein
MIQQTPDPTVYQTEFFIVDPTHDLYAAKIDYKDSHKMVGANYSTDATFLYKPFHHYDAVPRNYDRIRPCHWALRLNNASPNSVGQVTHAEKQLIIWGFQTDFSIQYLHMSKVCLSNICTERYSEGFAFVITNEGNTLHTLVDATSSRRDGIGYQGLATGLVIEFDLSESKSLDDPTYPHVSVQYRKSGGLSADHSYSLAFTHLTYELLDSKVHNIRITYKRQIDKVNFRTDNFHFTQYESEFLDFNNPAGTDWFSDLKSNTLGLLQIYVDDVLFPILSVPLNLAKMMKFDDHGQTNPETGRIDPMLAGSAYVGITASTNEQLYGAFQILAWTLSEVSMCPITSVKCSNSMMDGGQSFLTLHIKNIGTEKIYVKFKYQVPLYNSVNQWFDCRPPLTGLDYYDDIEVKIETSFYYPVRYGCNLDI